MPVALDDRARGTLILRLAGALLVASSLAVAIAAWLASLTSTSVWVPLAIDLAVGGSLLSGEARIRAIAIFRALVGGAIAIAYFVGALVVHQLDVVALTASQALLPFALVLALWGTASGARRRAAAVFGTAALVCALAGVPLARFLVSPAFNTVHGAGYSFVAPPTFAQQSDGAVVDPATGAKLLATCAPLTGSPDAFFTGLLDSIARGDNVQLKKRDGLHAELASEAQLDVVELHVVGTNACAMYAITPMAQRRQTRAALTSALASFR